MSGVVTKYVIPKVHYLIPAVVLLGTFTFWMGYKVYYSRPALKRRYERNGEAADLLWELTHPQDNSVKEFK